MPINPLGLEIDPEPNPRWPGKQIHTAKVSVKSRGYIPAHFHRCASPSDLTEFEVYRIIDGELEIFRRPPGSSVWERITLSSRFPKVIIPPGWSHGGISIGKETLSFFADSRVDHFLSKDLGGNVHQLPDEEQPPEILARMMMARAPSE